MKFKVFNAFLKERLALLCIYLINSFKMHIAKSFSNKRKNKKIAFLLPEIFEKANNGGLKNGLQE